MVAMLPHRTWNFDIDYYIQPIIPSLPRHRLPRFISRFLGYRREKPAETGNLMPIFWAFISIFAAILVLEITVAHVPSFESHNAPIIVASFGAAAVLEFYSIESPLAQPRNAILGQLIAAVTGVSVARLFSLSSTFYNIQWVAGALACASATALMALTKTVHPPAGATALLAVVDDQLLAMGWLLIPLVLLSCALMLGVALLLNNIERQFPMYWWTPEHGVRDGPILVRVQSEQTTEGREADAQGGGVSGLMEPNDSCPSRGDCTLNSGETTDVEMNASASRPFEYAQSDQLIIKHGRVIVPAHMFLTQEEELLLETMSYRV